MTDKSHSETAFICSLKWFNESKGFGFLVPEEGEYEGQDAFIHVSCFQRLGILCLGENARFLCYLVEKENGLFVEEALSTVDIGALENKKIKIAMPPEKGVQYTLMGEVKWFCKEKGFGFITGEDGEKDIFIHQTCLHRNGIATNDFSIGTKMKMSVREVEQGREVVELSLEE